MNKSEIMAMQQRINDRSDENLVVDGVWGPRSREASRRYLLSLMPHPNQWPKANQAALRAFYGEAGDESNLVVITFPYPMYYAGKLVRTTRVHKKCAASLLRILTAIGKSYGKQSGIMEEAQDFGGVFNNRNKRGGTSKSMHAYGAAIDLDADDNTFRDKWPEQSDMPLEICEEFAKEGWLSAAVFWQKDSMHFEATRI